jgi:hypothetical protein
MIVIKKVLRSILCVSKEKRWKNSVPADKPIITISKKSMSTYGT